MSKQIQIILSCTIVFLGGLSLFQGCGKVNFSDLKPTLAAAPIDPSMQEPTGTLSDPSTAPPELLPSASPSPTVSATPAPTAKPSASPSPSPYSCKYNKYNDDKDSGQKYYGKKDDDDDDDGDKDDDDDDDDDKDHDGKKDKDYYGDVACELKDAKGSSADRRVVLSLDNGKTGGDVCMSVNSCLVVVEAFAKARGCTITAGVATTPDNKASCTRVTRSGPGNGCRSAKVLTDAEVANILAEMGKDPTN